MKQEEIIEQLVNTNRQKLEAVFFRVKEIIDNDKKILKIIKKKVKQ